MKIKKIKKEFLKKKKKCILVGLLILFIFVGICNSYKPLPEGISFEGEVHKISESDIEFLHDLYNRYYPPVNSLRFRNTVLHVNGTQVTAYAPKEEWDFIGKWFGERFRRGDEELWKEIEDYIADPKERLNKLLKRVKTTEMEKLDDVDLGLL